MRPPLLLALAAFAGVVGTARAGSCVHLNNCNGRGTCDTVNSKCICFNGFGSESDVSLYKAPDCSARTCPSDRAWVDIPTGPTTAHAIAECSNMGVCERGLGKCRCFAGYEGEACQRSACPGSPACSGHGKCMSIKAMAGEPNAEPFGPANTYGGSPDTTTWDEDKIQGCVCDSAWAVGFKAGETQAPQFTSPDCSRKRCPSGDDPRTAEDESDCSNYADNGKTWGGDVGADGKRYKKGATVPASALPLTVSAYIPGETSGAEGNKCYVECSNRGICTSATGTCVCFTGYFGANCGLKLSQPVSST